MRVTLPMQKRFDIQIATTKKLYDLMGGPNKVMEDVAVKRLTPILEVGEGTLAVLSKTLDELEILQRDITWPGFQKTKVDWTLLVPLHEALARLEAWHEKQRLSPVPLVYPVSNPVPRVKKDAGNGVHIEGPLAEKVAVAQEPPSEGKETVAVAGPERPSPFEALRPLRKNESKALVEAARQYKNKAVFLAQKIEELRAEGFTVDASMFSFKQDEYLETVAQILPYVDSLEAENGRVANYIDQLREKSAAFDTLKRNYDALKRINDERIARDVGGARVASAE